jgi:hypothetical protein
MQPRHNLHRTDRQKLHTIDARDTTIEPQKINKRLQQTATMAGTEDLRKTEEEGMGGAVGDYGFQVDQIDQPGDDGVQVVGQIDQPGDEMPLIDLGWHKGLDKARPRVFEDISNEDVWLLMRRFNKTLFHVKATDTVPVGGLDLEVSPEEKFAPNKMRSQIERMYMTVIIGLFSFVKHISRLRSWRERNRTTIFCVIYFAAWALDCLVPTILLLSIVLVVSPAARQTLFPPFPNSLMTLSSIPTPPPAGILATSDSLTGAPEHLPGEAVENEASNFVSALGAIASNVVLGKDPHGEPNKEDEKIGVAVPEGNRLATMVATAKDRAEGVERPSGDKSKVAMETSVWEGMKPAMHLMTGVCDVWERFENLLSPKTPFDPDFHRKRLAGVVLLPLMLASTFLTRDFIFRAFTLFLGVGLFGDPAVQPICQWLDTNVPGWRVYLSINNTILAGVPTNAQLTLTHLRLAESHHSPLPPPPRSQNTPPQTPIDLSDPLALSASCGDQPLGIPDAELEETVARDNDVIQNAGGEDNEVTSSSSSRHGGKKSSSKILGFVRGVVKSGVRAAEGVDRMRAKAGNEGAKNRVGVIPSNRHKPVAGPVEFDAWFKGEKGFLCLTTTTTPTPILAFNKISATMKNQQLAEGIDHAVRENGEVDLQTVWSIPVAEIAEMRKHSGYGFKSKLVAGWGVGKQLNDSLGIVDWGGNSFAVTAIPHRDELFNRLVAVGEQNWEIW